MALSNLRNEPRREITEQVLGLAVGGGVLWLDWWVCSQGEYKHPENFWFNLVLLPVVFVWVVGFAFLVFGPLAHAVGELVCGGLAKIGLDPRPKDRYRGW